jgi:hypothetical protein
VAAIDCTKQSILDDLQGGHTGFEVESERKPDRCHIPYDRGDEGLVGQDAIFLLEIPVRAHDLS